MSALAATLAAHGLTVVYHHRTRHREVIVVRGTPDELARLTIADVWRTLLADNPPGQDGAVAVLLDLGPRGGRVRCLNAAQVHRLIHWRERTRSRNSDRRDNH
jgi:hypothetical protein